MDGDDGAERLADESRCNTPQDDPLPTGQPAGSGYDQVRAVLRGDVEDGRSRGPIGELRIHGESRLLQGCRETIERRPRMRTKLPKDGSWSDMKSGATRVVIVAA